MRASRMMGVLGVLVAVGAGAGCTASHGRTECGPTTCDFGQVCCNASCGICTAPLGGCIDLACLDAGPLLADGGGARDAGLRSDASPAFCGGFAGITCDRGSYCDFPDGSFCGGDDSTGFCVARPTDCPAPGGVPVCGCDGRDYFNACTANFAGTDVAHFGACAVTSHGEVAGWRECGPLDGPAWRLDFSTSGAATCDVSAGDGTFVVHVWSELEGFTGDIAIDGSFSSGEASFCAGPPGAPCQRAIGSLHVDWFVAGETARFDVDLTLDDGRRFSITDAEITSDWCSLTFPGCG